VLEVEIRGGADLREVARRLKAASNGKELRKRLLKEMRAATRPVVLEVRAAVMAVDSSGVRGGGASARGAHYSASHKRQIARRGLRRTIAAGVQLRSRLDGERAGIRVRIDKRQLPPDARNLPRYLNSPAGWRHPVFNRVDKAGNRIWVQQTGQPYFIAPIRRHAPMVRAAVERAVAGVLNDLAR
jgi:hypothetical protein